MHAVNVTKSSNQVTHVNHGSDRKYKMSEP